MSLAPLTHSAAEESRTHWIKSRWVPWGLAVATICTLGVGLAALMNDRWGEALTALVTLGALLGVGWAHRLRQGSLQRLRASEADLRAIAHALPDLAFVVDREGRFIDVFGNNERLLRHPKQALIGRFLGEFFDTDTASALMTVLGKALGTGSPQPLSHAIEVQGETRHFDSRCAPVAGSDRVMWVVWDVTERRRAEQRIELHAAALESSRDGMLVLNRAREIVSTNPAFTAITGYTELEATGQAVDFLFADQPDQVLNTLVETVRRTGTWQGEAWCQRKGGELFSTKLSVSAVQTARDVPTHFVAVFTDITAIKLSEARLARLAHYDPLTELPNRAMILDRLQHAVSLARRHQTLVGVIFIDLDNFKTVNDSLGHAAGDALLEQVSQRLRQRVRQEDTLGRLGGDEFVLVLEHLRHPQQAAHVAQAVTDTLAAPFMLDNGHEVYVRASIGISLFPNDSEDVGELIRNADAAMYQAKRLGRNTFKFYTEALTSQATQRLNLETRLRRAMERRDFMLHYQPMIALSTGRIDAVEALVRLRVPEATDECLPSIGPDEFIPIMEETGMIITLGEWVMTEACRQGRAWLDAGMDFGRVAVNVSASEIRRGGLIERVSRVLEETGLPAHRLELEITESGLMEHGDQAQTFLQQLHELGVKLSIDDFGTGYSSLAYLKRFPVHQLKIDRSFLQDCPGRGSDAQLVGTMIELAHNMNMQVVAEGVEHLGQAEFLQLRGCDLAQGYLYSRPVSPLEIEALLPRADTATSGAVNAPA